MITFRSPYDVGFYLLEQLSAAFEAEGRPMATRMVISGDVIVDNCCDGILLVRPGEQFQAIDPFPTVAQPGYPHDDRYIAMDISIHTSRCVPTIDDAGNIPPIAEVDAATQEILADAATVWNVLEGGVGRDEFDDPVLLVDNIVQTPEPDQGGCSSRVTTVTVGLPSDVWCP